MPVLVAWIVDGIVFIFRSRIGFVLLQIIGWLGISYGTQKILMGPVETQIQSYFSSMGSGGTLGAACLQWMGVLNLDKLVTMYLSAIAIKASVGAARMRILKKT
jgi:hypothetical protein